MTIKKFKVTATVEKQIEIEVNTDVINAEFLAEFSKGIFKVTSVEDIAGYVASCVATRDGYFIEGIGEYPKSREKENNLSNQGVHINYNDLNDDLELEVKEV